LYLGCEGFQGWLKHSVTAPWRSAHITAAKTSGKLARTFWDSRHRTADAFSKIASEIYHTAFSTPVRSQLRLHPIASHLQVLHYREDAMELCQQQGILVNQCIWTRLSCSPWSSQSERSVEIPPTRSTLLARHRTWAAAWNIAMASACAWRTCGGVGGRDNDLERLKQALDRDHLLNPGNWVRVECVGCVSR
jgi:hypothetical protein